ncbi:MAG: NAD-dependent deacylase [Pseudomonadota bacterium]
MQKLKEFLKSQDKIKMVVLTGAGISAESGIKTFRDNNGLWETHRVEEVATPEAFQKNEELVYRFYNLRRTQLLTCEPNEGHKALVEIEAMLGDDYFLITQNVDDLHERAGSKRLVHMHGEILKARCTVCEKVYDWKEDLDHTHKCVSCQNKLRPHIVWFGEMPFYMNEIYKLIQSCNLFVSIGTSGAVYPAAGFYQLAKQNNAFTVELNVEATGGMFDEVILGKASEAVEVLKDALLKCT